MRETNKIPNVSENLSSNTLFHFTNSFDKLTNIIKNGFKISYVPERLAKKNVFYIAPMVCFCDIPLGSVKVHLQRYGDYGIGIHKNFCRSKNINPVFYICNSSTFNFIFPEPLINFASVVPYLKKYRGKELKGEDSFRFYNEREWRYVVKEEARTSFGNIDVVEKNCRDLNKKFNQYLSFELNKIEYIIVRRRKELSLMVDFIDKHIATSGDNKKMLYTKIISTTRIKNDF